MSLQDFAFRADRASGAGRPSAPADLATPCRPVFVIDERLGILSCNAAARRMASEGLGCRGRFTAADKRFTAKLQAWLTRCRAGRASLEARWPLSLAGLRQMAVDAVHLPALGLCILSIEDPHAEIRRKLALVAVACGLTRTEERMLALVVEGLDTVCAAGRLGIAPTTARTHLQRLFAKTSTSRQSELVRFVATCVEDGC